MELKNFLFKYSQRSWRETNWVMLSATSLLPNPPQVVSWPLGRASTGIRILPWTGHIRPEQFQTIFQHKQKTDENQIEYQPVSTSKTIADNASINVVEIIIADCSPDSGVINFQSSLVRQRTSDQPDTDT